MNARWVVAAVAVIMVTPSVAYADRAVTGVVVDDATGLPIAGAYVTVGEGETATDEQGQFRIAEIPFGRLDVTVVAGGYRAYFGSARIGADLVRRLEADASSNEVIEMSGRAPTGPPLHLDTTAIRNQPGAGNDVLRALQSLPGVARTPFGLGGLALRGTAPRDTKVYLDDIEVPLLYHFGGLASFFPTAAVDEVTLEPGGASARYGRGLGGVALVTSRTGRRDRWRVGGEVSLIHAAAIAEGPGPLHGSWLVGARRSYFDAILAATEAKERRNLRYKTKLMSFQEIIAHWLREMGLIESFSVAEIAEGSNRWQAKVKTRAGASEVLLTDVGFGVSQVLPVVTLLQYVPEGSTVILEQPEIHLHPLAQAGLADVIIQAATNRRIQVILESHSEHLLLRLQRRIAEEEISSNDVKLYFCDAPKGISTLTPLELDLFGNIRNWPDRFMGDAFNEVAAAELKRIERRDQEAAE